MFRMKKTWVMITLLALVTTFSVMAAYIPNSRDTKPAPETIVYTIENPTDMEELFDNDEFTFYFRDSLDVLAIYDKEADHTYKTGLDQALGDEIEDACDDLLDTETYTDTDIENTCVAHEMLSDGQKIYGNSLIALEYLDDISEKSKTLYSSDEDYTSELSKVEGDGSHWVMDIDFSDYKARDSEFELSVRIHLYFSDTGVEFEIRDEEVVASERYKILNISVAPFMGAQGGTISQVEVDTEKHKADWVYLEDKVLNPGYSFVPDGSGALIRFEDTNIEVDEYQGRVYGGDLTRAYSSKEQELEYVDHQDAMLPVFGMSYGDDSDFGFVAYAESGDEYMMIHSTPLSSNFGYIQTYASFVYNETYYQIIGEDDFGGDLGYTKFAEEPNHFDVSLHFEFLNGDGSSNTYEASYVGMALTYRDFLLEQNVLTEMDSSLTDIPVRIDFLMADSKIGIFGYEEQVSTTASDVTEVLNDLHSNGVKNVNSGLLGWQEGGMILSSPKDHDFSGSIGSKGDFKDVFEEANSLGYDVSFVNDYAFINSDMASFYRDAVKHVSGQYYYKQLLNPQTVNEYVLSDPLDAIDWLDDHYDYFTDMGQTSMTIYGLTDNMYGAPRLNKSVLDINQLLNEELDKIEEDTLINGYQPNLYLLNSIDRYLNMPAFSSQYIIASDTVPFIELVLNNTLEMYAPYANFSFSSDRDVLRMIDYNLYPSFVITKEPSYILASTNSNNYISTQYVDYEDLIVETYAKVNDALKDVIGSDWVSREVITDGVIVNEYENGTRIVINYTDAEIQYDNNTVDALQYLVLKD